MAAQWPTSVATDANLYIAVNELQNALASGINNSVTTITLNSTTSFPTVGLVLIDNEVIKYTGISGADLTGCTRAFDGTTAASHSAAAVVSFAICADHHNVVKDELKAIETYLAANIGLGATPLTASKALATDSSKKIVSSSTSDTELGYVAGVTSAIQTQLNAKAGSPLTGDLSAGSHKITTLADGTALTDVTNVGQMLIQNMLINGGFDFWQRGTSFASPTSGAYTADRWQLIRSGGTPPTVTGAQDTSVREYGFASYDFNLTAVGASTPRAYIYQPMEKGSNYYGKTVTVSVRVKTSATNFKIAIDDNVSVTYSTAHTGSGNFELLSVTKTLSASAGALKVYVGFVDATPSGTGHSYIEGVMLVEGSALIPYRIPDVQVELARCQRYYEKSYAITTDPATATATNVVNVGCGAFGASTCRSGTFGFRVQKRGAPTVTVYDSSGSSGSAVWLANAGGTNTRVTTVTDQNINGFTVQQAVTNSDSAAQLHYVADAEI